METPLKVSGASRHPLVPCVQVLAFGVLLIPVEALHIGHPLY